MASVVVYTLPGCPHCTRARRILRGHGIDFEERPAAGLERGRETLRELTGGVTYPQVVVGDHVVGGADDLARLERSGALEALVAGEAFPRAVVRRRVTPGRALRWVLTTPFGGGCSPSQVTVDLVDARGRRVDRRPAPDGPSAQLLADALNGG